MGYGLLRGDLDLATAYLPERELAAMGSTELGEPCERAHVAVEVSRYDDTRLLGRRNEYRSLALTGDNKGNDVVEVSRVGEVVLAAIGAEKRLVEDSLPRSAAVAELLGLAPYPLPGVDGASPVAFVVEGVGSKGDLATEGPCQCVVVLVHALG